MTPHTAKAGSEICREPADLSCSQLRQGAVSAARGDTGFDLLITGGIVLDMVTGEKRAADIGIIGQMIASVHAPRTRDDASDIIDVSGCFLTPGLIDTHMHVESSMITPAAYADAVLARGVTTLAWDPHEFGNVHGVTGVDYAIRATRDLDTRFIILAPSCVPSAPGFERAGADFDASVLTQLLARPEVGGIAEVMAMREVITDDPRMSAIVNAGLSSGKPVCGHARSLSGADLQAFVSAGISSDHELVSADDLMEKLRAGLTIEMRGSHDHLLPEFVERLNTLGHLPQTVTLCTDDVFPDDLLNGGGLDDVVRRLIRYGMPAQWALQAATLNAARRFGRQDLGLIAPGKRADIVAFGDLKDLRAELVVTNGRPVAQKGSLIRAAKATPTPELQNSVKVAALKPDDFRIATRGKRLRLATIDRPRFTRWGEVEALAENGFVVPPAGCVMISVIHRHGLAPALPRTGFLREWGEWRGAFATSVAHDSHNLTVFGGNAEDMALAANAVTSCGGGMAVAQNGKIVAQLALPISGLVSDAPLADVARDFTTLRDAMDRVVEWQPPYLIFKACFGATLACNAGPHQTDMGVADVVGQRLLASPILEILA